MTSHFKLKKEKMLLEVSRVTRPAHALRGTLLQQKVCSYNCALHTMYVQLKLLAMLVAELEMQLGGSEVAGGNADLQCVDK